MCEMDRSNGVVVARRMRCKDHVDRLDVPSTMRDRKLVVPREDLPSARLGSALLGPGPQADGTDMVADTGASNKWARPAQPGSIPPAAGEVASTEASPSLTRVVGRNLRRLRTKRGLALEALSRASGVSRAMLSQVELGRSTPTINVLWKISRALGVPFSALIADPTDGQPTVMRASTAKVLTSHDGAFQSRALFPFDSPRIVEFYELRLSPNAVERADAHPAGTKENLAVAEGHLGMVIGGKRHRLRAGDAILFDADVPHEYWNEGTEPLRMYLVMTYGDQHR
jgi:transcriptional regulator with XRE-family HTH domain